MSYFFYFIYVVKKQILLSIVSLSSEKSLVELKKTEKSELKHKKNYIKQAPCDADRTRPNYQGPHVT
jgi:hypothetical protein